MSNSEKYIGISNRIPFDLIEIAIQDFLQKGKVDRYTYLPHVMQITTGENRAKKVLKHLMVMLNKTEYILSHFKDSLQHLDYFHLSLQDRKALILCLVSLAYPISYDIVTSMAVGFKVESTLSSQFIKQKVSSIYGGNRAAFIAIIEVTSQLIDCGVIKREKIGMYTMGSTLSITNEFIAELVIYTGIKLSGSKSILSDEISSRPWFSYFSLPTSASTTFKYLVTRKEGIIGSGYLTLTQ